MTTDPVRAHLKSGGLMSVEAYLRLDQSTFEARYEYLNGSARLMSGGSAEHDRIAYNMRVALDQHFFSGPCTVFGSDVQALVGVKPGGQVHYLYPDVTLSCDVADRRRGIKLIESPRLVVEVLSPSTEAIDRVTKLEIYQACATIQEILLISQFAPHVEVYRRAEEGSSAWSFAQYGPGSSIYLQSVDVSIMLSEIYRGIDFEAPLVEQ